MHKKLHPCVFALIGCPVYIHADELNHTNRYETTNHLWLILEYCVGGDLMSLLRQDVRLPEASVHDMARDLLVALQHLHAHAIIYCDVKPSNVLLDENGRLKLGGFGLSRRLSDINRNPVTNLPPVRSASADADAADCTAAAAAAADCTAAAAADCTADVFAAAATAGYALSPKPI